MGYATARKIGSSMVLELSPELESELQLREGAQIEVMGTPQKLSVRRRRYSLDELLARCDYSAPMSDEEREWVTSPPVGRELI